MKKFTSYRSLYIFLVLAIPFGDFPSHVNPAAHIHCSIHFQEQALSPQPASDHFAPWSSVKRLKISNLSGDEAVALLPQVIPYLTDPAAHEMIDQIIIRVTSNDCLPFLPSLIALLPVLEQVPSSIPLRNAHKNILKAIAQYGDPIAFLRDHGQTSLRLFSIILERGGDSSSSWAAFVEGLMLRLAPEEINRLEPGPEGWPPPNTLSPPLPKFPWKVVSQGGVCVGRVDRTLQVRLADGKTLGVKFLLDVEWASIFNQEASRAEAINQLSHEWGIGPLTYRPHGGTQAAVVDLESNSLEPDIAALLQAMKSQPDLPPLKKTKSNNYTVFVYEVTTPKGETHWRYLGDPSLTMSEFMDASQTGFEQLGHWAQHGLIDPDVIKMFHSFYEDRRYVMLSDLFMLGIGREGAGRLHAWTRAIQRPNWRLDGITDVTEVTSLKHLLDSPSHFASRLLANLKPSLSFHRVPVYLAVYLADYLIAWTLLAGNYWMEKDELNWQNALEVKEHAGVIRTQFQNLYRSFTGTQESSALQIALVEAVDWQRIARSMAWVMARERPYTTMLQTPFEESLVTLLFGDGAIVREGNFDRSENWGSISVEVIRQSLKKDGLAYTQEGFDRVIELYFDSVDLLPQVKPVPILFRFKSDAKFRLSQNTDSTEREALMKLFAERAMGWYADGVHPDLGPFNGPLPMPELSKAIYLFAVGMTYERATRNSARVRPVSA